MKSQGWRGMFFTFTFRSINSKTRRGAPRKGRGPDVVRYQLEQKNKVLVSERKLFVVIVSKFWKSENVRPVLVLSSRLKVQIGPLGCRISLKFSEVFRFANDSCFWSFGHVHFWVWRCIEYVFFGICWKSENCRPILLLSSRIKVKMRPLGCLISLKLFEVFRFANDLCFWNFCHAHLWLSRCIEYDFFLN